MKARRAWWGALVLGAAVGAGVLVSDATRAQILPSLPLGQVGGTLRPLTDAVAAVPDRAAERLSAVRLERFGSLARRYPDRIVLDPDGFPARAGELVVSDPPNGFLAAAEARGYRPIEQGDLLGGAFLRLAAPPGRSLKAAIRELGRFGARNVSADQLHEESGAIGAVEPLASAVGPRIGMIDGGVAGAVLQRGFAAGAPRASDHGTAVASLIAGHPPVRGAATGAQVIAADVYGTDPAGGNASAIARALAWLTGQGVSVVNISLVGPPNPLLARVVAAAQARGVAIVAPVGNDGPAAPPSYPASYPGVIAVTAVDGRGRLLIEAGRATHLDYAAPGADMRAARSRGDPVPVRGTSFAAPLVAGSLGRVYPRPDRARRAAALATLDASAK